MSSTFNEIAKDRTKMENFLTEELGLSMFTMAYVKDGNMNIIDTSSSNLLGTLGLFEVLKQKTELDKKNLFNKAGSNV